MLKNWIKCAVEISSQHWIVKLTGDVSFQNEAAGMICSLFLN